MKKQIDLQLIAIFSGGLLFNFLFWNEGLGLNLLLYTLFIMIILFSKNEDRINKKAIIIGSTHLLAAILTIYNHSILNIFTYYISLIIFVGFVHSTLIRSVFVAFLSGFLQLVSSPIKLIKKLLTAKIGNYSLKPILKLIKYIIIPIIVIFLFSFIYSVANPFFDNYLEKFATNICNFIVNVFTFLLGDLSFGRFMHIVFGILFTAGILLAFKENSLAKIESNAPENLVRKRKNKLITAFTHELKGIFIGTTMCKKMALKTENITGIISFAVLNLLLLFLNSIDFYTLWLGKMEFIVSNNYSAQLHEGSNALIVSIFMAMAVILYFFNGNLNFFSKNKTIKILAYLWIAQNAFLVLSVLLRDYNYISSHGLTYKRIGVIIFLILCTIGLITVYLKVAKQKTFFYLYKTNGLIWYVLLLISGFVNWDVFIVSYNINNRKSIVLDLNHLTDMSIKTLPLLYKNREVLNEYVFHSNYMRIVNNTNSTKGVEAKVGNVIDTLKTPIDSAKLAQENKMEAIIAFNDDLNNRIVRFNEKQKKISWLSWNYRDWQTNKYFQTPKP